MSAFDAILMLFDNTLFPFAETQILVFGMYAYVPSQVWLGAVWLGSCSAFEAISLCVKPR